MSNIIIKDLGSNLDITQNSSITDISKQISDINSKISTNTAKHLYQHHLKIQYFNDWNVIEYIWVDNTPSYSTSNWGSECEAYFHQWIFFVSNDGGQLGRVYVTSYTSTTVTAYHYYKSGIGNWPSTARSNTLTPYSYTLTNSQLF